MKLSIAYITISVVASVAARTLTISNHCSFTVWPGVYTGDGDGPTTGWVAPPQSSKEITVPDAWKTGRIWGRRSCDFSKPGTQDCLLGACAGGLECKGPGIAPVTLAEFALRQADGRDFYDVWVGDGFGIPLRITPSASACRMVECGIDLAPTCPDTLKGPYDTDGTPLGCKSACVAGSDGNSATSSNCCTGQYGSPEACPPSDIPFYDYFKSNCPDAFVSRLDDALQTCEEQQNSNYTITFCPP